MRSSSRHGRRTGAWKEEKVGKKKARGNGEGDVYPRKDKDGKVVGYRGAYWVHTAEGPKRRFVSGKTKTEARAALRQVRGTPPTGSPSKRAL